MLTAPSFGLANFTFNFQEHPALADFTFNFQEHPALVSRDCSSFAARSFPTSRIWKEDYCETTSCI